MEVVLHGNDKRYRTDMNNTCMIPRCATLLLLTIFSMTQFQNANTIEKAPSSVTTADRENTPINLIFDTDIWTDIDDAMALAMLHALVDRGEINLLAVTISSNYAWCASYVDLVDTFYAHTQVPIGINHKGMDVEYFRKRFQSTTWPDTHYTDRLSTRRNGNGTLVYPHHLLDGTTAPEAVTLLRKTLAAQADGSVVIVQVGYSTNLARLLRSPPDQISRFNGRELVSKKVRLLSVMAGNFRDKTIEGQTISKGVPEFNLEADIPSAQALFANWPTPIVASGLEIGLSLLFPSDRIQHDFGYTHDHPIVEAYRTYCEEHRPAPPLTCPHEHPTWDLTAVLYAVRPNRKYFSLSNPGHITVMDDGSSRFEETAGGRDRYLILQDAQQARTLEALVMLVSQPPKHGAR